MKREDLIVQEEVTIDQIEPDPFGSDDVETLLSNANSKRLDADAWILWFEKDVWTLEQAVFLLRSENPNATLYSDSSPFLCNHACFHYAEYAIAESAISAGTLPAEYRKYRPTDKEEQWIVRSDDFVVWASTKDSLQPLPQPLRVFLDEVLEKRKADEKERASELSKKVHGNTEVNAVKREQVLGAALACLATWNEECRKNDGTVNIAGLERLVRDKAPLFWEDALDPPLCAATIIELIKTWIRKTT